MSRNEWKSKGHWKYCLDTSTGIRPNRCLRVEMESQRTSSGSDRDRKHQKDRNRKTYTQAWGDNRTENHTTDDRTTGPQKTGKYPVDVPETWQSPESTSLTGSRTVVRTEGERRQKGRRGTQRSYQGIRRETYNSFETRLKSYFSRQIFNVTSVEDKI